MANRITNSPRYELRIDSATKARLGSKAKQAGIPLATAMRLGAERYLDEAIVSNNTYAMAVPANASVQDDPDDLVNQFRAVAARVESRLAANRSLHGKDNKGR